MPIPQAGDLLIRSIAETRFYVLDALTLDWLSGPFASLPEAVAAAREREAPAIWQQASDRRARPLGQPIRLPDLPAPPSDAADAVAPVTPTCRLGAHICVLYETADEQIGVAAEFLAEGLANGERAFYVAESAIALARFRARLESFGIDVRDALQRGALIHRTYADAHLIDGRFDSQRTLEILREATHAASTDGFAGLRTCGDMSWLLQEAPGSDQIVEYEAVLNRVFRGSRSAGMCQYDLTRVPSSVLDHALATHSSVVVEGRWQWNPHYRPPEIAITRTARPAHVAAKVAQLRKADAPS